MPKMIREADFVPTQSVWLKTDPEQNEGIVIGVLFILNGAMYRVQFGTDDPKEYYGFLLTDEKNVNIGAEKSNKL